MGRPQSPETRAKISESVKATWVVKKTAAPTLPQRLAESFARGHPDGMAPSAVRNYGSLGPVEGVAPMSPRRETFEEREAAADETAEKLGLRRGEDFKTIHEGDVGGTKGRVEVARPTELGLGTKAGR